MTASLFEYRLELAYYKFWEKKQRFTLYEDIYKEWSFLGVEEGAFEYEINGEKGTAAFGDLVVCPPNVPFRRVIISPLSFHHYKGLLLRQGSPLEDAGDNDPLGKINVSDTERLKANYEMLKSSGTRWHYGKQFARCSHYLNDIWYLCCNELEAGSPQVKMDGIKDQAMLQAMQQIRQKAFLPLNFGELADSIGISRSSFTQRFKKSYGLAPSQYLQTLRLDKAKTLLLETNLHLDEIAESCGYQNGYYLNRVFTNEINVTPGKFRRNNRI